MASYEIKCKIKVIGYMLIYKAYFYKDSICDSCKLIHVYYIMNLTKIFNLLPNNILSLVCDVFI